MKVLVIEDSKRLRRSLEHGLAELLDIEVQVGLEPTGIFHISLMVPRPAGGDATSIPHTDSYVTGD